jgi:16S rRNA C967 or C1407 C5-methylase (RsmB/RsmF family)
MADNPDKFHTSGHEVRTYPAMSGTDGFYVANLRRKQEEEETSS